MQEAVEAEEKSTAIVEANNSSRRRCAYVFLGLVLLSGTFLHTLLSQYRKWAEQHNTSTFRDVDGGKHSDEILKKFFGNLTDFGYGPTIKFPTVLYDMEVYRPDDFSNERGITPSFWSDEEDCHLRVPSYLIVRNEDVTGNGSNTTADRDKSCRSVWGPCYPPRQEVDWSLMTNGSKLIYANSMPKEETIGKFTAMRGLCRPGFLIIGQGKCGTSSLYHYLVEHPRVLPALQKQIHYFKYYHHQGLRWYLGNFPTTESFISHGALMTGEASPGYLPYPEVVALIAKEMYGTKIIMVARDPLERSYSSYRYNYRNPALEYMRKGRGSRQGIKAYQRNESYYESFLFSFEDMLKAELAMLRKCMNHTTGSAVVKARENYYEEFADEYDRREREGLPPLVALDNFCYGPLFTKNVPRIQWKEMAEAHPSKFLDVPNIHLVQSMIGRSLYVYPLEWWYASFGAKEIYFLCTEEMRDLGGQPLNDLGQFLGLPSYNFSSVVSRGMYNVGGHKGYDKVVSWSQVVEEREEEKSHLEGRENGNNSSKKPHKHKKSSVFDLPEDPTEIPLSKEFRQEMENFFKEHNERLFKLVGRTCDWGSKS